MTKAKAAMLGATDPIGVTLKIEKLLGTLRVPPYAACIRRQFERLRGR